MEPDDTRAMLSKALVLLTVFTLRCRLRIALRTRATIPKTDGKISERQQTNDKFILVRRRRKKRYRENERNSYRDR